MKKYIIFTLSLICTLFVTSCSNDASDSYDDATILLSKKTIEYGKDGGSETFTVTVNKKNNFVVQWENLVDWVEVSTNDNVVTVTVKPNKTANTRTAEILVFTQNGGLKRYVNITQTATDLIFNTTPDRVQFTRLGGEKEVRITTNNPDWTVEGDADWFKIEEVRPFGIIRLTATENRLDNERTAVITIKSGTEEKKIDIIQKGVAELILPYQDFGVLISEVIEFEKARGHIYNFTPKESGIAESHAFMTNSYLFPIILADYTIGAYIGAVVVNSILDDNTEKIKEYRSNYRALLIENGYKEKTKSEYTIPAERENANVVATMFSSGVLFDLYYKQMEPIPTFDKFPYGFMEWGSSQNEVSEYEASVRGTKVASAKKTLKFRAAKDEPDISYRTYFFNDETLSYLNQVMFELKGYSKIVHIGKNGIPRETEEFLALLEKENFKYLSRNEASTTMMYLRPSPKGGLWVTGCAIRVDIKKNTSSINLWDEEYDPAEEAPSSYIGKFNTSLDKTSIENRVKRIDEASRNRAKYVLK